ncbi:hexose kinase [Anaerococcus sp. AGMB00486]|uniref:Tagatose-6-phosphate kinase n=2 Tax=Anaerococcus TaxID=165779 RepID=A0ABX2N8V6_9FIRM|nr:MULTISPECIES: hexose kinase [Anaerococcus]MSS77464.1 hexose kinase [Anaerococcus porci]NVF11132.1 hexose kinase [Anaerococcus faecalis]
MILTITANPSVDISYKLDGFVIDDVNRTAKVEKDAGGKGIHVSYVLKELGEDVTNSGFIGGKLGEFIEKRLDERKISHDFIKLDDETRNCIAILHDGKQTEILEKGPEVSKEKEDEFLAHLKEIANNLDIISISGSLPKGLDSNFYKKIIEFAKNENIFVALDTSGSTLKDLVNADFKPDLIKPNEKEIIDIIGKKFPEEDEKIKEIFSNSVLSEIKYIIVSQGASGAVVKINDKIYKTAVPKVEALNPVGSGDSSLAGAISAIFNKESGEDFIRKSMNCGLLNVLNEEIAHVNMNDFDKYYEKISIKEI